MLPYAITIFLAAFLLFQVQPMVGKFLLPWFGGSPAVWTTCLLFFQSYLVLGYVYGHWVSRQAAPRKARWIQLTLLLFTLGFLLASALIGGVPLLPSMRLGLQIPPVLKILFLLAISVGFPYLLLAATSPLVQHWFNRAFPGRSPYRLYALSNFGSMLALVTYPLAVEPFFPLKTQAILWTGGFVVFAGSCFYCCWLATREVSLPVSNAPDLVNRSSTFSEKKPSWRLRFSWIGLAACASVLLLAVTNQICQEVAVIPFLWVLPLSLYLVTFVICFDKEKWYRRNFFMAGLLVSVSLVLIALQAGIEIPVGWQLFSYASLIFFAAMVCHGELVRKKPAPEFLTLFYLSVSLGGALGGIFVGLVAPVLFSGFWELHLGLWLVCLIAVVVCLLDQQSWVYRRTGWPVLIILWLLGWITLSVFNLEFVHSPLSTLREVFLSWGNGLLIAVLLIFAIMSWLQKMGGRRTSSWLNIRGLVVALMIVAVLLADQLRTSYLNSRVRSRNFFGVLTVLDEDSDNPEEHALRLRHGQITHGLQYLSPGKRNLITTYYNPISGLGLAFNKLRTKTLAVSGEQNGLCVGMLGLGVGTIAAYTSSWDSLRIYEINPDVIKFSSLPDPLFTFICDSSARKTMVVGDARISLEYEKEQDQPQHFDLLAIDVFSSDSIPVHLLTREAMAIYLYHLKPEGIIALHVSNRYLDLKPVVWALAQSYQLTAVRVFTHKQGINWQSDWMLLSRDEKLMADPMIWKLGQFAPKEIAMKYLWTDDFSNLIQCLK
jgi:hypothetical protein